MRPIRASSLLLAATGAVASPVASEAQQIPSIWRDVTSIGVTCLVQTPGGVDNGPVHARLCEAVRSRVAPGSPVPVQVVALSGESLAPGRVTLLVHASLTEIRGQPLIALSVRPFRNASDAGQFFGAPPRVVAADDDAALDAAIRAILAETLPWQAANQHGSKPLQRKPKTTLK